MFSAMGHLADSVSRLLYLGLLFKPPVRRRAYLKKKKKVFIKIKSIKHMFVHSSIQQSKKIKKRTFLNNKSILRLKTRKRGHMIRHIF